jgi:hypothetical protein
VQGISKDEPGIADDKVKELRDFLYRGFFKGTTLNFSSYTKLDADTMPERLKDLAREVTSVTIDERANYRESSGQNTTPDTILTTETPSKNVM